MRLCVLAAACPAGFSAAQERGQCLLLLTKLHGGAGEVHKGTNKRRHAHRQRGSRAPQGVQPEHGVLLPGYAVMERVFRCLQ